MEEKNSIPGFKAELLEEPYVQHLHSIIYALTNRLSEFDKKVEELEAEIRRLKKLPKKPKITPSQLDKTPEEGSGPDDSKKRNKGGKRKKKENLEIHDTQDIALEDVPSGWEFTGYEIRIIQDFVVRANNIEYRLEVWKSPDGKEQRMASLPAELQNTHFGSTLKGYILHEYYACGVS